MHAKKLDQIATAVLYSIAGIIVAILASLILYILVRGLPHISWSFLTGKSSSYQAGGGIGIQLYNSFFLLVITLIISVPLSMGATRWQTIWRVTLKAARSGIFTAVVFGMARAFGEALAIQMVVGNSAVVPTSLTTPAATLTSVLTMGIGNTVMGTVDNNVLWSLALVLLLMSLAFNSVIKLITKERGKKNYAR